MCARSVGPLSLMTGMLCSEGRQSVKGGRFLPALRTLDRLPRFRTIKAEGKGAGGLRGLAPWRSMRQRLMRACGAPSPAHSPFSPRFSTIASELLSVRLSFAPVSPRFHPHSVVASATVPFGVLNTRGAAISVSICRVPVAWFPTICRDLAVTPTRRFRISRRIPVPSQAQSFLPLLP